MNRWIFGMQNTGKTTFLAHEIIRDIADGNNVIVFDPNGELIDAVLLRFSKRRLFDVLIVDPTDIRPVGFNPLQGVKNKPYVAELLKDTIKVLAGYETSATPIMERVLFTSIASLLDVPRATLLDIEPLLTDKRYRGRVLKHVEDGYLLRKWEYWARKNDKDWDALISSTENKVGDFAEDPRIRNVLSHNTFDLSTLLFEQSVILVRLPQLELGSKSRSFGSLMLAYLMAVCARRGVASPVNVYIDDCNVFDTPVLRRFIAQSRRLNVSLTVSNQYLAQLSRDLRSALLGNCEIRVMFRTGIEDSEYLHKTLPHDIVKLLLHERLPFKPMFFDGHGVSDLAIPPLPFGRPRYVPEVVEQSRRRYGS